MSRLRPASILRESDRSPARHAAGAARGRRPRGRTAIAQGLLFRVATTDVTVLAAPLVVLAAAACAAALPPALRAVRIDPARTLRAE